MPVMDTPSHPIVLYPFRYFDIRTRKWWRARYLCEIGEISERYAAFKIIGQPEVRHVPDDVRDRFPTRPGQR